MRPATRIRATGLRAASTPSSTIPNFAGGFFSFWDREGVRLTGTGVGLVNGGSLVPDLRSSKTGGPIELRQPGTVPIQCRRGHRHHAETARLREFEPASLRPHRAAGAAAVSSADPCWIGADSGIGVSYRPPLSENIVLTGGVNALVPFQGFRDISTNRTLFSSLL